MIPGAPTPSNDPATLQAMLAAERIESVVDVTDDSCPCCSGPLHHVGEDAYERLDVVPAQFRVLVVRRPRYACRACTDGVARHPRRRG